MLDTLFNDITGFIFGLIGIILFYTWIFWWWGGMMLANMVGPLFLWWGWSLPDIDTLRVVMILLPTLPFLCFWFTSKIIDKGGDLVCYGTFFLCIGSIIINLWMIPAALGGQFWVRNKVYQHLNHDQRVEFWHWRASDFLKVDLDGSGNNMQYINMRLEEIGAAPIGRNPKSSNPKNYRKIAQ